MDTCICWYIRKRICRVIHKKKSAIIKAKSRREMELQKINYQTKFKCHQQLATDNKIKMTAGYMINFRGRF